MLARKAVALMSGGLDSNLAVAIVKAQGIEIEGLNFSSVFGCCKIDAIRSAEELGVPITVISKQEEYLKLIEKPKYGYGQGMNPCVDCRIHMFALARAFMETIGASFVISGEVGIGKPEPGIFLLALERLGVSPQAAVMVGDSLARDIQGAQRAGIKAVWLNREGAALPEGVRPDAVASALRRPVADATDYQPEGAIR